MQGLLTFVLLLFCLNCHPSSLSLLNETDVLNRVDQSPYALPMSDLGNWQGYLLPVPDSTHLAGSFIGPFDFDHHRWITKHLVRFKLSGFHHNTIKKVNYFSLPGVLIEKYTQNNIDITHRLFFIGPYTAAISTTLINRNPSIVTLKPMFVLQFPHISAQKLDENYYQFSCTDSLISSLTILSDGNFIANKKKSIIYLHHKNCQLPAGDSASYGVTISAFFPLKKTDEVVATGLNYLKHPEPLFNKNRSRWQHYFSKMINPDWLGINKDSLKILTSKAIQTLINNWRKPHGALQHEGLFPSSSVRYFNGFWAWDSWKQAVALVAFEPQLAKNQILAMLDYQNSQGMIADCIYADSTENNWRNTKPPLAAWAVWNVFLQTQDTSFLKITFPRLLKYHYWWYKYRDCNHNGWCEYGSSDGTPEAAAWESGMDNAVRFDSITMVRISDNAYCMSRESVDLNAYLLAEKKFLAQIAGMINARAEKNRFLFDYFQFKQQFDSRFFNPKFHCYTDFDLNKENFVNQVGPESWIPLWAGIATSQAAEFTKNLLLDSTQFNTFIPFPTVSASSHKFDPTAYWRGPVWLDQAYFALIGLQRYGYHREARTLLQKLLTHSDGLFTKGTPIHENYNPLTGEPLNAPHFSWSAAHLLMMLSNFSQ